MTEALKQVEVKKMDVPVITLSTLNDGAALELWQVALGEVLRNIQDPNTDAKKARAIRLEFVLKPMDDERHDVAVGIQCTTKLANGNGVATLIHVGRNQGELVAVERPRQTDLFQEPGGELVSIAGGKKE